MKSIIIITIISLLLSFSVSATTQNLSNINSINAYVKDSVITVNISGYFGNSCYELNDVTYNVDDTGYVYTISAFENRLNQICTMSSFTTFSLVPWWFEMKFPIEKEGTYRFIANSRNGQMIEDNLTYFNE